MPSFTTRVELHSANYSDYERLHTAMEKEGFSRFIQSDSGTMYHLPTAEYNLSGNLTKEQVLAAAKRAATTTGRTFAVIVTESNGRTWEGLAKAQR